MGGRALLGVHGGEAAWGVVGQPRTRLRAEGLLCFCELQAHASPSASLLLAAMDFASSPARESRPTSALWACAAWCRPKTESIPARMPCRSSAWLTAFFVR